MSMSPSNAVFWRHYIAKYLFFGDITMQRRRERIWLINLCWARVLYPNWFPRMKVFLCDTIKQAACSVYWQMLQCLWSNKTPSACMFRQQYGSMLRGLVLLGKDIDSSCLENGIFCLMSSWHLIRMKNTVSYSIASHNFAIWLK